MKRSQINIAAMLWFVCLAAVPVCSAQRSGLPRIRALRADQPPPASRGGCANHPISFNKLGERKLFDSDENGQDAYMNLDGQNVKLRLVRTILDHIDEYGTADATYEYRHKQIKINVRLRLVSDYIDWVPAKVTVRRGRAVKTFNAFVAPQCDAL